METSAHPESTAILRPEFPRWAPGKAGSNFWGETNNSLNYAHNNITKKRIKFLFLASFRELLLCLTLQGIKEAGLAFLAKIIIHSSFPCPAGSIHTKVGISNFWKIVRCDSKNENCQCPQNCR